MSRLNQTIVQGNLGRDPELRHTDSGKALCKFTVATWRSDGGTQWFHVTCWEKTATAVGENLKKGDTVKWTYVASVPTHLPSTDIMAFREPSDLEGFTLDTPVLIDKLVKSKIESTFKILDWDIDAATGAPRPKSYY